MKRDFLKICCLFGLAHLGTVLALDFMIFALSHLPPEHFDFSAPIRFLSAIYSVLILPRMWLRWLWPFETTPQLIIYAVVIANSVLWGAAFALLRQWHQTPARKR